MAEKKEQLRIEGELDTSKLKSGAKQGFAEIQKEEKKVQQESRQTSKALDDIGTSGKNVGRAMQQAGQQSTSALKNIGNEAKNTATQIDNIAKATKQIKLQQALGAANRAISELAPVGQMLGKAAGMSDVDISLAGAGISGAMSGAMAGAVAGPWGAAIGGLVGAGASLLQAGEELQKAAKSEQDKFKANREKEERRVADAKFLEELKNASPDELFKMLAAERQNQSDIQGRIDKIFSTGVGSGLSNKQLLALTKQGNSEYDKLNSSRADSEARIKAILETMGKLGQSMVDKNTALLKQTAERQMQNEAFGKSISETNLAEGRQKERYGLEAQVNTFIKGNKFDDAFKLIDEQEDRFRQLFEEAEKTAGDTSLELSQRQEAWKNRNVFKSELDFVGTLSDRISDAQGKFEENTAKKGRNKEIKSIEDFLGYVDRVGGNSLTDALTRVGGGGGYGVQMNGIATKVTKISSTLQEILAELKKENGESSVGTFVEG